MARQDLIAALKNALERGEALDEAKLSLLNAGYERNEIEKAASELETFRKIPKPRFL